MKSVLVSFGAAIVLAASLLASEAGPVQGKVVISGRSFDLRYAWVVRGPDHFEPSRTRTYIVMSADDVSDEIRKCPDVTCAIFGVLKDGLILENDDAGFWIRAVNPAFAKEKQMSGPTHDDTGWTATVNQADRIAGHLRWVPQGVDPPILDFTVDATLLKEYPAPAGPTPRAR